MLHIQRPLLRKVSGPTFNKEGGKVNKNEHIEIRSRNFLNFAPTMVDGDEYFPILEDLKRLPAHFCTLGRPF